MHRWAACPGSIRLCKDRPQESSSYAKEGTLAHELAAFLLQGKSPGLIEFPDLEMKEVVQFYIDYCHQRWSESKGKDSVFLVEQRFDLTKLYPNLYGTSDCVIYDANKKHLIVIDFKYGAGIAVDVFENQQLQYYGLGSLRALPYPCKTVELVIVQPRCPHPDGVVRSWQFKAIDLIDFAADLIDFAKRTEDPNAPLVLGEHCHFCPASPICPTMQAKALALAKEEFSPVKFDNKSLGELMTWLPTLKAWVKNVEEFAYLEAEKGRPPQGFKLVDKRGVRKWKSEPEVFNRIKELSYSKDDFLDLSLKSAPQVEKFLGKKEFEKFKDLVTQVSSGTTLVEVSDPRPEVKKDPQSEFKVINEASKKLDDLLL